MKRRAPATGLYKMYLRVAVLTYLIGMGLLLFAFFIFPSMRPGSALLFIWFGPLTALLWEQLSVREESHEPEACERINRLVMTLRALLAACVGLLPLLSLSLSGLNPGSIRLLTYTASAFTGILLCVWLALKYLSARMSNRPA